MTQQAEQSFDERWKQRDERSRVFLETIDQLDDAIAATEDKKLRADLQRQRAKVGQEFAQHLDEGRLGYAGSRSRSVMPVWRVSRVPAKKHRAQAQAWMAQRDIDWDGSARSLCHEVRKALERDEPIPNGNFGLYVERTVSITLPRAFTMNILGQPVHVVPKCDVDTVVKEALEDSFRSED